MDAKQKRELRKLLVAHLDMGELETVCFDWGVDWDTIAGDTVPDKVRQLFIYTEKRPAQYALSDLFEIVHEHYPALDFTPFGGPGPQTSGATRPTRTSSSSSPSSSSGRDTERNKKHMTYENFDIVLREELDDSFTVSASHDFRGGAQSDPYNFQYDVEGGELADLFSYLQELVAEKEDIEKLGKQMYALLFSPAVSELYVTLKERLREDGRGVRIRVDIRSAASRNDTFSP